MLVSVAGAAAVDVSQLRYVLCCALQLVSIVDVCHAKCSDVQVMIMINLMTTALNAWKCNDSQVLVLLFKGCKHDSHELHSITFVERLGHLLLHQLLFSGRELLSQLDPACRHRDLSHVEPCSGGPPVRVPHT